MGWNGGTAIFDCVVEDLLGSDSIDNDDFNYVVLNLYNQLCSQDWDNFCESKYYMDEGVMEALGKLEEYQEWLEEQQDECN